MQGTVLVLKTAKESRWEFSRIGSILLNFFTMLNLIGVEYTYFMLVENGPNFNSRGIMKSWWWDADEVFNFVSPYCLKNFFKQCSYITCVILKKRENVWGGGEGKSQFFLSLLNLLQTYVRADPSDWVHLSLAISNSRLAFDSTCSLFQEQSANDHSHGPLYPSLVPTYQLSHLLFKHFLIGV